MTTNLDPKSALNPLSNISEIEDVESLSNSDLDPIYFQYTTEIAADEVFWMKPDSTLFYVNQLACDKLGYTKDELLGKKVWDWDPSVPEDVWPEFWANVQQQKHIIFETNHQTKHGHIFPVEIQAHHIKKNGTEFLIAFVVDISDRKEKEKEIEMYQNNLEKIIEEKTKKLQAEKDYANNIAAKLEIEKEKAIKASEIKSQFLANMSHEIRTPMNGIHGMVNALQKSELSDMQASNVNAIKNCVSSLMKIINDILDLSKIESGKLSIESIPFNIAKLFNDIKSTATNLIGGKAINFSLNYTDDDFLNIDYLGDPTRLNQIMLNLVGNAIKFTESGTITVNASINPINSDQKTLHVDVIDSGIGIDDLAKDKLFSPFSQEDNSTTRKFGGTGLGLNICKQLVEAMGGSIGFDSKVKNGSTFWFEIPLGVAQNSEIAIEEPNTLTPDWESFKFSGAKALLVEDNIINREVALLSLNEADLTTDIAENGEEALNLINNNHYDIIFMDCHMPVMDGYEATKHIRQKYHLSQLPIIALTASAMEGEREKCLNAGMTAYLTKPFEYTGIVQVLTTHIPNHQSIRT